MVDFCHITPTKYLNEFAAGRSHHLLLAHLVEEDPAYREWYQELSRDPDTTIIMDNGGFECFKAGKPMYPSDKLIEMGTQCGADYIVMSDYPGEHWTKTVEAAEYTAEEIRDAGFGTFFVPQSEIGDLHGLQESFFWAADSDLVDYIGVSILAVPNAYGVEKNNKLQRFLSRWMFLNTIAEDGILDEKKIHLLGMVDGPNEILLLENFLHQIDTWDSSAAVWAGFCGIEFDQSPTGLINGKNEIEVNFAFDSATDEQMEMARENVQYIDDLLELSDQPFTSDQLLSVFDGGKE